MLTVCGQQHSFRHINGYLCERVNVFETENVSTYGGIEPQNFAFMPYAVTIWAIRAKHVLSHGFNAGSGGLDIFKIKLVFDVYVSTYRYTHVCLFIVT